MPAAERARVEAHLRECERCSSERQRIRSTLPRGPSETGNNGAAGLLAAIREWESARAPDLSGKSIKQRVAEKLASLLGTAAARKILEPVSESGDNLLPAIDPVLATFLGQRAATQLTGRITLQVLVRR